MKAYSDIFSLRFNQANKLIEEELKLNPSNEAVLFLKSKILFVSAFISESEADFDLLKQTMDNDLIILENSKHKNPFNRLARAEMLMQTAVIKIKFREFFTAALEIRSAFKLLEENTKQFPHFKPNLKGIGILHALIGAVPDNYQWVVRLIGLHGTIKQGTAELNQLYSAIQLETELSWLKEETLFLMIYTNHHLLKDYVLTNSLISTVDLKDAGPLLCFVVSNYYNTTGQSQKTLALLENLKLNSSYYPLPYLGFMHGSALLYNLDTNARQYFIAYLLEFKGQNFIKSAYQKLAWVSFLNGDTTSYFSYLKQAKITGNDLLDEDKQALKEALDNEIPNLYLLKARLLFDGGYYQKAMHELSGKKVHQFPRLKDQLELTYRMGRIFDKSGQKEKAKSYYETTYTNGRFQTWYYAANSALHLGILFEEAGDTVSAEIYYKKCLALRNHEYQNSIDQKAKSGLNRLGK